MSTQPVTVRRTATLAEAHQLMRDHQARHLPVVDGTGNICGLVSQRDLYLMESLPGVDQDEVCVEEAMTERPFVVTSDTALDEVAEIMGEHKYGSVVVMGKQGIEGIFTATDACRALTQILRRAAE